MFKQTPVDPYLALVVICLDFLFLNNSPYQENHSDIPIAKHVDDDVHGHGLGRHLLNLLRHQAEQGYC